MSHSTHTRSFQRQVFQAIICTLVLTIKLNKKKYTKDTKKIKKKQNWPS